MTAFRRRTRSQRRGALASLLGVACALVIGAAPVAANHDLYQRVSTGFGGGNGGFGASFVGSSNDGRRAFFITAEKLALNDTDGIVDIYERSGGATRRVSIGTINGNGAIQPIFRHVSADGTRATFSTSESLLPTDTDVKIDIYQRSGSTTALVSAGQINGNLGVDATFAGATPDGSRIFFQTQEQLVTSDTDSAIDVYERFGGTTTLVSAGQIGGNGALPATFVGSTELGDRVWFSTQEKLVSADTDNALDIYERSGGQTFRISRGTINGNGPFDANFLDATGNGSRIFYSTGEALASTDLDGALDIYSFDGLTVEHVSRGTIGGNGAQAATFNAASADGNVVLFSTSEQLVSADTDATMDIYQRANGQTFRLTGGQVNGNLQINVVFAAASADGSHVFFTTQESLLTTDADTSVDLYERFGSTTRLVSIGNINGNGVFPATFSGASADGTRVFFVTAEKLLGADTDGAPDLYERINGTVTDQISLGNGQSAATFGGVTPSGSAVFFGSLDKILIDDTDTFVDVYGAFVP